MGRWGDGERGGSGEMGGWGDGEMGREGEGVITPLTCRPLTFLPCPIPHALFLFTCGGVNSGSISFNHFPGAGTVNH